MLRLLSAVLKAFLILFFEKHHRWLQATCKRLCRSDAMRVKTSASQACGSTSLKLCRHDQREHDGRPIGAAIGTSE
jgi:hypothetical protein